MVLVVSFPRAKTRRRIVGKKEAERNLEELAQKHGRSTWQFQKDISNVVEAVYLSSQLAGASWYIEQLLPDGKNPYGRTLEEITSYFEGVFRTNFGADRYRLRRLTSIRKKYRYGDNIPVNKDEADAHNGLLRQVGNAKNNLLRNHTNSTLETPRFSMLEEDGNRDRAVQKAFGTARSLQEYIYNMAFEPTGKANKKYNKGYEGHIAICQHCSAYRQLVMSLAETSTGFVQSNPRQHNPIIKTIPMYGR